MAKIAVLFLFARMLTVTASAFGGSATSDRDILIALYNQTAGDQWQDASGWKEAPIGVDGFNEDPCAPPTWFGISCREDRVIRIRFTENCLRGQIPTQLSDLSELEALELSRNKDDFFGCGELIGPIPPQLGNLSQLRELSLFSNQLTGEIPTSLASLNNLEVLELRDNQLSGTIPGELGDLENLAVLNLGSNSLGGEIPPLLGGLQKLEVLALFSNNLGGEIPSELGNLSKLLALSLPDNQLSGEIPASLGNLTDLMVLYLFSNELTGAIPPELGSLVQLVDLQLFLNDLSGEIPASLGNLASLRILNLSHNRLGGAIPPELGQLGELFWLILSSNELTGAIPPKLSELRSLANLALTSNQLTGNIPAELGELSSLEILSLGGNQLTGPIPPEIGGLSSLRLLILGIGGLTGPIPPELGNLENLELLTLHSNRLEGEIPRELARLENLRDAGHFLSGGGLNLNSNHLYTDSNSLRAFIDSKHQVGATSWESTQTLSLYFAHVANGADFSSQILLFNLNDESAATATIEISGDDGQGLDLNLNGQVVSGVLTDVMIPKSGLLTLTTDGVGEVETGSIRVTSDLHVQGVVVFGGATGLAGVGGSPAFPTGFVAPMQTSEASSVRTGIAIANLRDDENPLSLTLLDAGGSQLATAEESLPPLGHKALFVDEVSWNQPVELSDFTGVLAVIGAHPVVATVLQTHAQELVTMPVTALKTSEPATGSISERGSTGDEQTLYFAQFAAGGGLSSQIMLVNRSSEMSATATITITSPNGEPLSVSLNGEDAQGRLVDVVVPAGGIRTFAADSTGSLVVGSVAVSSDESLSGVVVFTAPGIGAAGVGSSIPLAEGFVAPMETNIEQGITTGVAMMNLEAAENAVMVELMSEDGEVLAEAQRSLPASGQLPILVDEFDWNVPLDFARFTGLLRVRTEGQLAATVIQLRSGGQYATMPVTPKPGQ